MSKTATKIESDYWEEIKARGFEIEMFTMWTAVELFGKTEKTISQAKFPTAKFWWTPSGSLIEYKGRRELVPQAGVAKVRCF